MNIEETAGLIEKEIKDKRIAFMIKNSSRPNYIKIPLWCCEELKRKLIMTTVKLDYFSEKLMYQNLILCPTIDIEKIEEIEVF